MVKLVAKGARGKNFLRLSVVLWPALAIGLFLYFANQLGVVTKSKPLSYLWETLELAPLGSMVSTTVLLIILLMFHAATMWFGTKVLIGNGSMGRSTYFFLCGVSGYSATLVAAVYMLASFPPPELANLPWFAYLLLGAQVLLYPLLFSMPISLFSAMFLWDGVGRFTLLDKVSTQ